jgi:hypothetical protein
MYILVEQTVVTANNYMFRSLTGHRQVVHPMERGWGCTAPNPFPLDVQPDDGLLEAETCSCKLLPSSVMRVYTYNIIVMF